jgi:hypothetical protein
MTFIKDPQGLKRSLARKFFSQSFPVTVFITFEPKWRWVASLEIITPVLMWIQVFWDLKACRLVNRYRYFGQSCCFHFQVRNSLKLPSHWRWKQNLQLNKTLQQQQQQHNNNNKNNQFLTMLEAPHQVVTVVTPSESCGIDRHGIS